VVSDPARPGRRTAGRASLALSSKQDIGW
jgi:hypothetical protein